MKHILTKCPICGGKIYHDTLSQYALRQFFKKDGELSKRTKKVDYGTLECGIICCADCDFTTDAEYKGEPPYDNIKITTSDNVYYWENLDEDDKFAWTEKQEKFREIGIQTKNELVDFIDTINEMDESEEIKSETYGFFESETPFRDSPQPAYVIMTKYKGKYVVWLTGDGGEDIIFDTHYELCDIFSTYEEADIYFRSLVHSGIKSKEEQIEECKSELIGEDYTSIEAELICDRLNIKVWYRDCLIIEHLTNFDVQYINRAIAMFNDLQRRKKINIYDIYKKKDDFNYQRYYIIEYGKKNETESHTIQVHIPSRYQGQVRCVFDLINEDTL